MIARADRAHVAITTPAIGELETYYRLLARWNRTINLTALRLEPIVNSSLDRLLIEPLAAARFVEGLPIRWMDLGSGGGSPAIPLKVVRPQLMLTMVEARERKAAFLREAARDLRLTGAEVLSERFEELPNRRPDFGGLHGLVTVRAVKVDMGLLSVCRWLLAPGGRLFLFGAPDISHLMNSEFETVELVELGVEASNLSILTAGPA